jgi:hypothetical protein
MVAVMGDVGDDSAGFGETALFSIVNETTARAC